MRPREGAALPPAGSYYGVDTRKLSLGELWRLAKLAFPLLVVLKILRIRLPVRVAMSYPPRVIRVDDSELDVDGRRARLRRDLEALARAGFGYRFAYRVASVSPDSTSIAAAFLDAEGRTYALIGEAIARMGNRTVRQKQVGMVTPLANGRFLSTASRRDLDAPPELDREIVRRGTERLVRRHRERLAAEIHSPRAIDPERLEELVVELERRWADYQIARGVWTPLSERQVEKLRAGKPRGRGWHLRQKAVAWGLGIGLGVVWSLGGVGGWGNGDQLEGDVENLWSGETRVVHSCAGGAGAPSSGPPDRQVATIAAVFDSVATAAATEEPARSLAESSGGGAFHRVGNALFYRTTSGSVRDARPVYEAWREPARSVAVLGATRDQRALAFTAVWRTAGREAEERAESVDAYLGVPLAHALRPPWATVEGGVAAVSPEQANARRSLYRLQQAELKELVDAGILDLFDVVGSLWHTFTSGPDDWEAQMLVEHDERIEGLRALAASLRREDPTLDGPTMELYIAEQDRMARRALPGGLDDPFAEEPEGQAPGLPFASGFSPPLLARLGPLEEVVDAETGERHVVDPLAPFAVTSGWSQRSGEEFGARFMLPDPAVAAPAILGYLCAGGVDEVTIGLSTEAW